MSKQPSISQASRGSASTASSVSKRVTQGSNRLYDIPSLEDDGSNFQNWKFRVTKVLKIRRLWKVVDGTEKKPDDSDQMLLDEWLEQDEEAHAQITLTLKDELLQRGYPYTLFLSLPHTHLSHDRLSDHNPKP
jgi:hypothetical protein